MQFDSFLVHQDVHRLLFWNSRL